ncbi:uncharacterized protein LOC135078203 [Ostrinia nubilalis]|uniref:uncharacterized protein LOC135078203 n=1 Tax=Ostrinia nubilalis TaxID=29057 RepID=UPI00308256A9
MGSTVQNTNYWHCYICELDIPASHIEEHNESWKHSMYVSICQESLKRLNNHITVRNSDLSHCKESTNITDFCANCSVIVENNDHKASRNHNQSKTKDVLMENLFKLYVSSSNFNEKFLNELKNTITKLVTLLSTESERTISDRKYKTTEPLNNGITYDKYIKPSISEADTQTNSNTFNNSECIIEVQSPNNDKKVNIVDNNDCNKHDHLLKLKVEKTISENRIVHDQLLQKSEKSSKFDCKICCIEIEDNPKMIETHIKSSEHIFLFHNLFGDRLKCIVCNIHHVTPKCELLHINSNKQSIEPAAVTKKNDDYEKVVNRLCNDNIRKTFAKLYKNEKVDNNLEADIQSSKASINSPIIGWDEDGESVDGKDMIINNISKFYKDENAEDNLEKNIQSSKAIVNIPKLRWDEDGENVTGIDMVLPEVLNDSISGNTSCSDKYYFDSERKMSNKNRKKKVNKAIHSKKKKRSKKNKSNHQTEEPPDPLMDIDLVKKGPNIIYCKLCRITVSNKPGHDSRHFKGNLHSTERHFFLTRNKITASHFYENYGYLHCGWCNIHFYEGFIHEHVLSESHTTHIQELIEYENKRLEYYTREAEHQKILCV